MGHPDCFRNDITTHQFAEVWIFLNSMNWNIIMYPVCTSHTHTQTHTLITMAKSNHLFSINWNDKNKIKIILLFTHRHTLRVPFKTGISESSALLNSEESTKQAYYCFRGAVNFWLFFFFFNLNLHGSDLRFWYGDLLLKILHSCSLFCFQFSTDYEYIDFFYPLLFWISMNSDGLFFLFLFVNYYDYYYYY